MFNRRYHKAQCLIKFTSINSSILPTLINVMLTLDILFVNKGLKTACSGFASLTFQPYFVPQLLGGKTDLDRRNTLCGSQDRKLSHPYVQIVNGTKHTHTQTKSKLKTLQYVVMRFLVIPEIKIHHMIYEIKAQSIYFPNK